MLDDQPAVRPRQIAEACVFWIRFSWKFFSFYARYLVMFHIDVLVVKPFVFRLITSHAKSVNRLNFQLNKCSLTLNITTSQVAAIFLFSRITPIFQNFSSFYVLYTCLVVCLVRNHTSKLLNIIIFSRSFTFGECSTVDGRIQLFFLDALVMLFCLILLQPFFLIMVPVAYVS